MAIYLFTNLSKLNKSLLNRTNAMAVSLINISMALLLALSVMGLGSTAQAANNDTSDTVTRAMAANPDNFKPVSVNGRALAAAIAPCPITKGLISCTLDKLALINGAAASVHDDYDQVQVFFYPNTEQPKTAVVIAQKTGLMDDSVDGERYRISFKLDNGQRANATWNLVQYGVQYKCSRGDAAGMWVQAGCL